MLVSKMGKEDGKVAPLMDKHSLLSFAAFLHSKPAAFKQLFPSELSFSFSALFESFIFQVAKLRY